jgi:hypothetical protein
MLFVKAWDEANMVSVAMGELQQKYRLDTAALQIAMVCSHQQIAIGGFL